MAEIKNMTVINRLKALIDKVDTMQKTDGQCKQRERNLRKNQKEMLEIKNQTNHEQK